MNNILKSSFLATALLITLSLISTNSFAQCIVTGNTPEGGEVVVCSGTDTNGITTTEQADDVTVEKSADITRTGKNAIDTLDGDDKVLVKGGMVRALSDRDAINLGIGNDELLMEAGTVIGGDEGINTSDGKNKITIKGGFIQGLTDEGIQTGNDEDEVYIMGGEIIGTDSAVQTFGADDKIIITGGLMIQDDNGSTTIEANEGNDLISVSHATIDGSMTNEGAIAGGQDDDIVRIGTGAKIIGTIYGNFFDIIGPGGTGFDTLVFEMAVPQKFIDQICSSILAQDPDAGSVTVIGLTYEWRDFDVILCELVPSDPRPIPTLSEWGLIAMAGVLGLAGLLYIARRRAAKASI